MKSKKNAKKAKSPPASDGERAFKESVRAGRICWSMSLADSLLGVRASDLSPKGDSRAIIVMPAEGNWELTDAARSLHIDLHTIALRRIIVGTPAVIAYSQVRKNR